MIDAIHRLRELLQHLPGLKRNQPELQIFLRKTRAVEDLRHFVQHFRSEIESFTSCGMPLWGTLSWASRNSETGLPENHMVIPGTFFDEVWVESCRFDAQKGKFADRVLLYAGPKKIDLADLCEDVEKFVAWYVKWFEGAFSDTNLLGSDAHAILMYRPAPNESK